MENNGPCHLPRGVGRRNILDSVRRLYAKNHCKLSAPAEHVPVFEGGEKNRTPFEGTNKPEKILVQFKNANVHVRDAQPRLSLRKPPSRISTNVAFRK